MALSKLNFKCYDSWYVEFDCLEMGASLAVTLATLWLKEVEFALLLDILSGTGIHPANDKNGLQPCCTRSNIQIKGD